MAACSSLVACGGPSSVSYDAIINPAGAVAFTLRPDLETYAENNTPSTQKDANTLLNAYGKVIPAGSRVKVTATALMAKVDPLLNDRHICQVQYSGQTYWIGCWDARKVHLRTASDKAFSVKHGPLPLLGENLTAAKATLAGYEAPSDSGDLEYSLPIQNEKINLSVEAMSYKDGGSRVSLLDFRQHNGIISAARKRYILSFVMPKDAVSVSSGSLPSIALAVIIPGTTSHSVRFYSSKSLARAVQSTSYRLDGAWKSGACPDSKPGILEEFQQFTPSGATKRIDFAAIYPNVCQRVGA